MAKVKTPSLGLFLPYGLGCITCWLGGLSLPPQSPCPHVSMSLHMLSRSIVKLLTTALSLGEEEAQFLVRGILVNTVLIPF